MSIWVKSDFKQVYINIGGDVCAEHIEFLKNKLLDHLHDGYRRIVVNIDDVHNCHSHALAMLSYVQYRMLTCDGELIIEDKHGIIEDLAQALIPGSAMSAC